MVKVGRLLGSTGAKLTISFQLSMKDFPFYPV